MRWTRRTRVALEAKERKPPAATSNSPTRGRVKLLHPLARQDTRKLADRFVLRRASGGILQSPAFAVKLEGMAVMHQAVE